MRHKAKKAPVVEKAIAAVKAAPGRRATLQTELAVLLFANAKEGEVITDEMLLQAVKQLINLVNMPLDIVVASHDNRTGRFHVANVMPESQMTPDMLRAVLHGTIDLVTREETLQAAKQMAEQQAATAATAPPAGGPA